MNPCANQTITAGLHFPICKLREVKVKQVSSSWAVLIFEADYFLMGLPCTEQDI